MMQYIDHQHDDGVEIYHFRRVSRAAIDEFYSIAMPIFRAHIEQYQDKVPLCYVLDLSESGMFPVKYMMTKAIEEIGNEAYQPQHYIAYVTRTPQDKMLINILEQLAARNLAHTRKIFKPDQFDTALEWLKSVRISFVEELE
ncbi:MAG: hypothetical protein ACFE0Q_03275 [Anaerolineae bacterium]